MLTRPYSITSIGILEKSLKDSFENSVPLMQRLLDIQDVAVDQQLTEAADEPDNPDITWTTFSIAQRRILAKRVNRGIVPLLYRIFFELPSYKEAFEEYTNELKKWEKIAAENRDDSHDYQLAFDSLKAFQVPKQNSGAYPIVRTFGRKHSEWRNNDLCPVMGLALFQRSIFLTLRDLMDALPDYPIQRIGDGLILLLARAMDSKIGLFSPIRHYTLKTIWHESGAVVNREFTRRQLSRLTLAMCGGIDAATIIANAVEPDNIRVESIVDRLRSLGEERAAEYWHRFVMDRQNHFARTYLTNLGLDQGEINFLRQAKEEQDAETKLIRAGELDEDDAVKSFDRAVHKYLREELKHAEEQLREVLQLTSHIVSPDFFEDNVDEE